MCSVNENKNVYVCSSIRLGKIGLKMLGNNCKMVITMGLMRPNALSLYSKKTCCGVLWEFSKTAQFYSALESSVALKWPFVSQWTIRLRVTNKIIS